MLLPPLVARFHLMRCEWMRLVELDSFGDASVDMVMLVHVVVWGYGGLTWVESMELESGWKLWRVEE